MAKPNIVLPRVPMPEPAGRKESKKERFHRLAKSRMANAIRAIELIGNCSSKSSYEYTDEEIKKMFTRLHEVVSEAQIRFNHQSREGHGRFEF